MKKNLFITLLAALFSINYCYAQDSFDKTVEYLLNQNYDIIVSYEENELELNELKSDNNLPETEVSFSRRWGNIDGQKTGVEISQGFDWPGLYAARSRQHSLTKEAISFLQKSRILDKKNEIRLLLIDYIAAKQKVELAKEVYGNMNKLVEKYRRAYEAGEVSIIDRNKVIVETARAKAALMTAEHEREDVVAAILAQGKDNSVMPMLAALTRYPDLILYPEEEYEDMINNQDPMLEYYRRMDNVAAQQQKVAKLGYMPSFSVGYGYEYEEGQAFHGFNVGIGLPLFSNRHKTKSAHLSRLVNENNLNAEKLRQITKMRNMVADVKLMDGTIDTFRDLFENQNQLSLLKKAFDGGEINLFTYLADMNYFTEARAGYIDAQYTRAKLLVELNKLK